MLTSRLNLWQRIHLLRRCSTTSVGQQKEAAVEMHDPLQAHALKEQCILVDENDKAVGAATKADCHRVHTETKDVKLHRAFSVFLFNTKGEMLVQRRSVHKVETDEPYEVFWYQAMTFSDHFPWHLYKRLLQSSSARNWAGAAGVKSTGNTPGGPASS